MHTVTTGAYAGANSEGPEYETIWSFTGPIGSTNIEATIAADSICDDLGIDTITTGNCVGFAFELYEKGIQKPTVEQLVESEETIRSRYKFAKEKYGDRMTFTGPDCGLGSWPSQEAAELLLKRTVKAVKTAH